MALKERNRHLALAAELLQVHLPAVLAAGDEELGRDLLCVLAAGLQSAYDDAEASAEAWDERAYHSKADALRREWAWAETAIRYAQMLARSDNALGPAQVERISWLIPIELTPPARPRLSNLERMRGSCRGQRKQAASQRRTKSSAPSRSTSRSRSATRSKSASRAKSAPRPRSASRSRSA